MLCGSSYCLISIFSLTVNEVLEMLDKEQDDEYDKLIYVTPPEDGAETDEEHEANLNHLGRKMLLSECELQVVCRDNSDIFVVDATFEDIHDNSMKNGTNTQNKQRRLSFEGLCESSTASDQCSSTSVSKLGPNTKSNINNSKPKWKNSKPSFSLNTKCNPIPPSEEATKCVTPLDFCFFLFFTDDLLRHICTQSNLYASQKNCNLGLDTEELLVVIRGFLLSGYAKYRNKRMFWSKENDVPTLLLQSIRCNRFERIQRNLHLNDNTKHDASDKLFKLRPLLDMLGTSFKKHGGLDENLSVDESMIPYYGKHYAKQFIRGKPIRFGFKNWAVCSSRGYMVTFQVYTGKENSRPKEFGLGGSIVLSLINAAEIPEHGGHKVFFDNYFTSLKLLRHLASRGICATGTLQENRVEQCPLRSKPIMKKEQRGSYDYSSCGDVLVVRWNDNSVVTAATNYENLTISSTTRWSSANKSKVSVPQPILFSSYNKSMGGVDKVDQFVASYRSRMRQKKWWWPIFLYFLDVCVVNAWLLYRTQTTEKPYKSLLNFQLLSLY